MKIMLWMHSHNNTIPFSLYSKTLTPAMETEKLQLRFSVGRQSSLAPERDSAEDVAEALDPTVRLMYLANEGDLVGIEELLDSGSDVSFTDIDGRTALHVAACQGRTDVVDLLVRRGADVDPRDRWGSTVILLPYSFVIRLVHSLSLIFGLDCLTASSWCNVLQKPRHREAFGETRCKTSCLSLLFLSFFLLDLKQFMLFVWRV